MTARRGAEAELGGRYVEALDAYLARPDEEALSAAYQLGRDALASGLGVLAMATVHGKALTRILQQRPADTLAQVAAAEDFFRELLSPFEMTLRGFAETNAELQRMNEALVREREAALAANRELEAFSYSVSHDLRAPLRGISGFSRILQEEASAELSPEAMAHLSRIVQATGRMNQLIDDLLGLSRVARRELVRARIDLTALAARVCEHLRVADPERDVEIVVHPALVVDADAGLLAVVIENLLGNAWKFTSKRATARIELGRSTEHARPSIYYVRDDGAGFDMAYAKKLFAPFQRLHTTSEFEGTGIGLATVQRIVQRHGGRIWAESEPNHGATFYFTLGDEVVG